MNRNVRKRIQWILGCIVVFCVTYALILPAITASDTAYCGVEEHTHTEQCYEKILICEEETASVDEEIVETQGNETEEQEEAVHEHTESCYERGGLICNSEEHTHELACFSNPEADLETEEIWKNTLPKERTGVLSEDLLAAAESQMGYAESQENYIVSEGEEKKGYTRYGEWCGDPYGDWNTMFVAFCMHYAEVDESLILQEKDVQKWIERWQEMQRYREADTYIPAPGDIIFVTKEDHAEMRIGIVSDVLTEASDETAKLKVIEGDALDEVSYCLYEQADRQILGYGKLSEKQDVQPEELPEMEVPEETEEITQEIIEEENETDITLQVTVYEVNPYNTNTSDTLLKQDGIAEEKLENPDFYFQVFAEDGTPYMSEVTAYVILDADGNVSESIQTDENGVFSLKANQTAVFSNLEGTKGRCFVRELLDEQIVGKYETVIVDGNEVTIDVGNQVEIASNKYVGIDSPAKEMKEGSVSFTFCNQRKLTTLDENIEVEDGEIVKESFVEIPFMKQFEDTDGSERAFVFVLEEVADRGEEEVLADGVKEEVVLTFHAGTGNQQKGAFVITYEEQDVEEGTVVYYYKLTEKAEEQLDIQYDEKIYLVEVTVSKDEEQGMMAKITNIWDKKGKNLSEITFTNYQTFSLLLEEKAEDNVSPEESVPFEISLAKAEEPLIRTFQAVFTDAQGNQKIEEIDSDIDGKIYTELKANESLQIYGLPKETKWKIEEKNADSYYVTYAIDEKEEIAGTFVEGKIEANSKVTFVNQLQFVLPETGGSGTTTMVLSGAILMIFASLIWIKKSKGERI